MTQEQIEEQVAMAMWQEENMRVMGRRRLIAWEDAATGDHERWVGLARAAIRAYSMAVQVAPAAAGTEPHRR